MTTVTTAALDYEGIAEAFVHPLKLRILALMAEPPPPRAVSEGSPEPGWSPNGLYVAVGDTLGNVSYHERVAGTLANPSGNTKALLSQGSVPVMDHH